MTAADIAAFNVQKNDLTRLLHAATIEFVEAKPGTVYSVGFGDARVEGDLHESGQALDLLRSGWLFWPITALFAPGILMTFVIRSHATNAALVGTRWQIQSQAVANLESDAKFECRRTASA